MATEEKQGPLTKRARTGNIKCCVKICGVRTVEAACAASQAGCDLIGMIFVEKSKRRISVENAQSIVQALHGGSGSKVEPIEQSLSVGVPANDMSTAQWFKCRADWLLCAKPKNRPLAVGVFFNERAERILEVVDKVGLDCVQLHGSESIETIKAVREARPIIKAIHMGKETSAEAALEELESFKGLVDVALLDTAVKVASDSNSGVAAGGTGKKFDWTIALELATKHQLPVIMAGGLGPDNVAAAIQQACPWGVDVASGVEKEDGTQDLEKITAFVHNAK